MINQLQNDDTSFSLSPVVNLIRKFTELSTEQCFKEMQISSLKYEVESEKFLHNYYKELYMNLLNSEVDQCWN